MKSSSRIVSCLWLIHLESLEIIIQKADFVDSLFNLGATFTSKPTEKTTEKKLTQYEKDLQKKYAIEYFPFNPIFETSDVVKKGKCDNSNKILENADIEEQMLLFTLLENNKNNISGQPHLDQDNQQSITNIEKSSSGKLVKSEFTKVAQNPSIEVTEFDETPQTEPETTKFVKGNNIEAQNFEQGNAVASSSDSRKTDSRHSIDKIKKEPILDDSEFFSQDITIDIKNQLTMTTNLATSTLVEETKDFEESKTPLKVSTIDFSTLDDMGDILDCDLNGDLNEDEYLETLVMPNPMVQSSRKTDVQISVENMDEKKPQNFSSSPIKGSGSYNYTNKELDNFFTSS